MNQAPIVSIVTPAYNTGRFLRETISSIRQQTYSHIEHIVVDGGSTDDTLAILQESGVRWLSEPDDGVYEALNKGFRLATGQIFTYINSDDMYMHADVVRMVVSELLNDDSIDFAFGHCAFTDETGRILYTYRAPSFNRRTATSLDRILFQQPTCFWRRRVHRPFNTSYRHCGDSDFFIYLCDSHRGKNLKITIAKFRIREDCVSFLNAHRYEEECVRVFEQKNGSPKPPYLKMYDFYVRYALNWRANVVRLRLKLQNRPYL